MPDETNEILQRLARVETKIDMMLEEREVAAQALKTANEALQSAEFARQQIGEVRSDVTWAWRTALGALITGAIALIWKAVGA